VPSGIGTSHQAPRAPAILVTLTTPPPFTAASLVSYGPALGNLSLTAPAVAAPFTDSNNTQTIHVATLTGLAPQTRVWYAVGDGTPGNTSAVASFVTAPPAGVSPASPFTFAIFGDMGIDANAHLTLPYLVADAASGAIDAVLHIGDAAYDLDSNNGANGDAFMVNAQGYAATVPMHTCPGNHESANDFAQYLARLGVAMPAPATSPPGNGTFHSFNVGLVHVVMVSTEAYFYPTAHGLLMLPAQYAWLEADLAAVDRSVTPWIILMVRGGEGGRGGGGG
jgi:acid phosphatase type 7